MDHTASALYEKLSSRGADATTLEVMGHKAASLWRDGVVDNLSEAVVRVVKTAGLSNEEIKRVIEFTNSTAFLDEFQKSASKYVSFDPADPPIVFQSISGTHHTQASDMSDYATGPTRKEASMDLLEEAFAVSGHEYPYAEPLKEAMDLRDKLAGAIDYMTHELSESEIIFSMASDELYRSVKTAALDGTSMVDVVRAFASQGATEDYVKVAFMILTPRLLRDGVFHDSTLQASFNKQASSGVLNTSHPLVVAYRDFQLAFDKMASARGTREDVEVAYFEVDQFLKEAVEAQPIWDKVRNSAAGLADEAKDLTEQGVGKLLGEGGTKKHLPGLVHKAVKYAPHTLGAIAAYNAYQRGKEVAETPLGNSIASAIPYTDANRMAHQRRMMEAMQGRDDVNYGVNYSF